MDISVQLEIKNKKKYYEYLKDNSFWIKELNRNPHNINSFNNYVKDKYHLKIKDKLKDSISNIDTVMSILDVLK